MVKWSKTNIYSNRFVLNYFRYVSNMIVKEHEDKISRKNMNYVPLLYKTLHIDLYHV